jgi:hypothetical protein
MLKIFESQREDLRAVARDAYIAEQCDILKQRHPQQWDVLGDLGGRKVVSFGIDRAEAHGFNSRGGVRLWLQLMFLFGSYFDEDPLFPPAAQRWIRCEDPERQPRFAAELHKIACDVLDEVGGSNNIHNRAFLKSLEASIADRRFDSPKTLKADLLGYMSELHPRRMKYFGKTTHLAQISGALADAQTNGLEDARGGALFALLAYILGAGFWRDPLYPWVVDTLEDERRADPAERAARLERRARLYLRAVIDNLKIT